MTGGPLPVLMAVAGPAQQQRSTVLFRVLLAIPHFVVLYFLAIGAAFVLFVGWFGALFTGRLPEFAVEYMTGYTRWNTRVAAYTFLLTDVYPPFSLDDEPGYPVRIAIAPRDRLNRLAVFFRFILVIPAILIVTLVSLGGTFIVAFAGWLITLFTGKLPTGLHLAYAAILRYQLRTNCYHYLLTAAYPGGLFGDGPAAADFGAPSGYGAPGYADPVGYDAPGYAGPAGYGAADGYGAAPGYGMPGSPRPAAPADWRLRLTPGARGLLSMFIGLGVVWFIVYIVVLVVIVAAGNNAVNTSNAINQVSAAHTTLVNEMTSWEATAQSCNSDLTCFRAADGKAAGYFTTFASVLRNTPMPSGATAAANSLDSDARKVAQDLSQLSQATTVSKYQTIFTSSGLQQTQNKFDQDYDALGSALDAS